MRVSVHLIESFTDIVNLTIGAMITLKWASNKVSNDVDDTGEDHSEDTFPALHVAWLLAFGVLQNVLLEDAVASVEELSDGHKHHAKSSDLLGALAFLPED